MHAVCHSAGSRFKKSDPHSIVGWVNRLVGMDRRATGAVKKVIQRIHI